MALFRRTSRTIDPLIREANEAFVNFSPKDEYVDTVLKPVLPKLYAAIRMRDFRTVDEIDAVAEPLRSMPPSPPHSAPRPFSTRPDASWRRIRSGRH